MLHITLYNNYAEKNELNKSPLLFQLYEIEGVLRERTSIINPEITISITNNIQVSTILNCNYMYIQEFNRYYFVNDIISESDNLWRFILNEDVLMSFKSGISDLQAFIDRSENGYDEYLPDDLLPIESYNTLEEVLADGYNASYILKNFKNLSRSSDYCCVIQFMAAYSSMGTASVGNFTNFNSCVICTYDQLLVITKELITHDNWTSNGLKMFTGNPSDCIAGIKIYPFNISLFSGHGFAMLTSTDSIPWGNSSLSIPNLGTVYFLVAHRPIVIDYGNISVNVSSKQYPYMYLQPYSNMQLYLPYYGFVDIDVNAFFKIEDGTSKIHIKLYYYIDIVSGDCMVELRNTDGLLIAIHNFDISIDLPIGHSNATDAKRNALFGAINFAMSAATLGAGLSIGDANISALESRSTPRTNIRTKLGQQINRAKLEQKYDMISGGSNLVSSALGILGSCVIRLNGGGHTNSINRGYVNDYFINSDRPSIPYLLLKLPVPKLNQQDKSRYAHLIGLPTMRSTRIGSLYGFMRVAYIHIKNIDGLMENEADLIEDILKSGIVNSPNT